MQRGTCHKCKRTISVEAEICPECGFDPQKEGHTTDALLGVVGVLLSFTVVLSPFGIALMLYVERRQAKRPKRPVQSSYNSS